MRRPAAVVLVLGALAGGAAGAAGVAAAGQGGNPAAWTLSISNDGGVLAAVPVDGGSFAVSYRNSLYGSTAEERYEIRPDGSYLLVQLAADDLAVLEEYYAVPGAPDPAEPGDRRNWVAAPDPSRPAAFTSLSVAATDLGQRTVHTAGAPPLDLWTLVDDGDPFVTLELKENQ
ncbi:hypothetical protein OL239_02130 [Arthrobacter sp. ATA002]|uniref:hypothetical protein n=1 Tax=Arthrobacter sp. ATA002 TaxID=2991715 RepID=UPI0022A6C3F6|nr:hypothetical protein [Arthrobacter sp. ATA002]WAP52137.1 hypothetical protein OL239_02130 [Arthrobacter sp. ATA002]